MVGAEATSKFQNREMQRRARWAAAICLLMIAGALFTLAFEMLRREAADRALLAAVRSGNASAATSALRFGANPNLRGTRFYDENERYGLWQRLSALLRSRAVRPSPKELLQPTALMLAVSVGRMDLVHTLLRSGAEVNAHKRDGSTALSYAIWRGNLDVMRVLLDRGADPNAGTVQGRTPLMIAATEGKAPAIALLLAHGANVHTKDAYGNTPLILAAYRGAAAAVDLLLRAGDKIDAADRSGFTALHHSAEHPDPAVLVLLLDRGANLHARDRIGQTPLFVAVDLKQWNNVRLLAARGADLNAHDKEGRTPLMLLVAEAPMDDEMSMPEGYLPNSPAFFVHENERYDRHFSPARCVEGVRLLAELGADVNARDRVGETALRDAIQFHKQESVIAALKQAGAHL